MNVPLVCRGTDPNEYKRNGFNDHPIRQGWASFGNEYAWCNCSADVLAIRAQSWLFFGLLSEYLGKPIQTEHFVDHENLIVASRVEDIVYSRLRQVLSTQPSGPRWYHLEYQRNVELDEAFVCCDTASRHVQQLDELASVHESGRSIELSAIACSIKLLIDLLLQVKQAYCLEIRRHSSGVPRWLSSPKTKILTGLIPPIRYPPVAKSLCERARLAGWCPFQIRRFTARFSSSTFNFLINLSSPGTAGERHKRCSENHCVGDHVQLQSYQTQHSESCSSLQESQCGFVGFKSANIARIIAEGCTPLVAISNVDGKINIDLVKGKSTDAYIVISHVWSGGLGNVENNKLPLCQLRRLWEELQSLKDQGITKKSIRRMLWANKIGENRLSRMAASLTARVNDEPKQQILFWMDTLCVPVDHIDLQWREVAINNMAAIYAGASIMFVMDQQYEHSTSVSRPVERNAQLLCSAWMSRLWTLQEAALGLDWYIATKDNLVSGYQINNDANYKGGFEEPRLTSDDGSSSHLWDISSHGRRTEISEIFKDIHLCARTKEFMIWKGNWRLTSHYGSVLRFTRAWNSLAGRSTTMQRDSHVILASILDLSPSHILALPEEMRMKAVLRSHTHLPIGLLYEEGPRVPNATMMDGWIPAFPGHTLLALEYGIMKVAGENLSIKLDAADIYHSAFDSAQILVYTVPPNIPRTETLCLIDPSTNDHIWIELCSSHSPNPAGYNNQATLFIVHKIHRASRLSPSPPSYLPKGARLEVIKSSGPNLHALYDCPLKIHTSKPLSPSSPSPPSPPSFPPFPSTLLPPSTTIHILTTLPTAPTYHKPLHPTQLTFETLLTLLTLYTLLPLLLLLPILLTTLPPHPPLSLDLLLWFLLSLLRILHLTLELTTWYSTLTPFKSWIDLQLTHPPLHPSQSTSDPHHRRYSRLHSLLAFWGTITYTRALLVLLGCCALLLLAEPVIGTPLAGSRALRVMSLAFGVEIVLRLGSRACISARAAALWSYMQKSWRRGGVLLKRKNHEGRDGEGEGETTALLRAATQGVEQRRVERRRWRRGVGRWVQLGGIEVVVGGRGYLGMVVGYAVRSVGRWWGGVGGVVMEGRGWVGRLGGEWRGEVGKWGGEWRMEVRRWWRGLKEGGEGV